MKDFCLVDGHELTREEKIKNGLYAHLQDAMKHYPDNQIVGLFLQGSQNYNLDTEDSDIDTKLIVTPSLRNLAMNDKPISLTFVRDNEEHLDEKDVRLYIDTFRKGNMNFLEILFTDFFVVNPLYVDEWNILVSHREEIARMNPYRVMNAMYGMCGEKNHALTHRYPAKQHLIDMYGYDGKQLSHQERVRHAMIKYAAGDDYWSCIHEPFEPYYLKMMKRHVLPLEEAKAMSDWSLAEAKKIKDEFCAIVPNQENEETLKLLKDVQYSIIEKSIREEMFRAE